MWGAGGGTRMPLIRERIVDRLFKTPLILGGGILKPEPSLASSYLIAKCRNFQARVHSGTKQATVRHQVKVHRTPANPNPESLEFGHCVPVPGIPPCGG